MALQTHQVVHPRTSDFIHLNDAVTYNNCHATVHATKTSNKNFYPMKRIAQLLMKTSKGQQTYKNRTFINSDGFFPEGSIGPVHSLEGIEDLEFRSRARIWGSEFGIYWP